MGNQLLRWVGISGMLAVVLGAFGAHFLESQLGPTSVETFNTGVRYQFYHTLAIFGIALWMKHQPAPSSILNWSARCFFMGILAFSGSLYLLSTRAITGLEVSWLGPVTPLGGTFFIAGWLLILIRTYKK